MSKTCILCNEFIYNDIVENRLNIFHRQPGLYVWQNFQQAFESSFLECRDRAKSECLSIQVCCMDVLRPIACSDVVADMHLQCLDVVSAQILFSELLANQWLGAAGILHANHSISTPRVNYSFWTNGQGKIFMVMIMYGMKQWSIFAREYDPKCVLSKGSRLFLNETLLIKE